MICVRFASDLRQIKKEKNGCEKGDDYLLRKYEQSN